MPSPGSGTASSLPENQQFLANTCCSVLLLLHYLRSKVGLRRTEAIDLCDEQGTLKLLFLVKLPSDSASKFLSPRGTYYVCRVERGAPGTKQENTYRAFTPILKDPEPELLDALHTQCEFLEKSRLKLLKAQDGKKIQTMESLISIVPSQISVSSMPLACSAGSPLPGSGRGDLALSALVSGEVYVRGGSGSGSARKEGVSRSSETPRVRVGNKSQGH
ncbi:uncharacterized protein CXorf65 homolog [Gopherus evgoodei]|uniref:uncharacterized protein CXorf65 homolog n=1 Tax=Gopherus evgoodei TaxID=1825980 RepID=UPI0011CF7266|nr:uncharacterized protein CXorf65 homolog [Gopherus evgoodei]